MEEEPTAAYSKPVGYVTQGLGQGFTAIGLTLHSQSIASGKFETISATVATDNDITYSPEPNRTYVLEITSGTVSGAIFEVLSSNLAGNSVTVSTNPPTDLVALGVTTADTYSIRRAPTLEEVFSTVSLPSGILQAGISDVGADVVWVPVSVGVYNRYFLHTSGEFRQAGVGNPAPAAPNIPLIYSDGLYVQRKSTTVSSLTISGEVKSVGTTTMIGQGINLVSVVAPVGLNLQNAGLEDDVQRGLGEVGADVIWIQKADRSYDKYFLHNTGTWRNVTAPLVPLTVQEAEAVSLPSCILIQRKVSSTAVLDLNVPPSYSSF